MKKFLKTLIFISIFFLSFPMFSLSSTVFKYNDIFKIQSISDIKYSPDGNFIVFTKRYADKKKDRWVSQIFYATPDFSKVVQLTRKGSNFSPQISPDSSKIAFISTRNKKSEIFVIELPGGDPEKISNYPLSINAFKWLGNNKIIFTAREKKGFVERKREKEKDTSIVIEDIKEFYPIRLFCLNLKNKKYKRISYNKSQIGEFVISPSNKFILTSEIDSPKYTVDARYYKKYFIYNIKTGKAKQIFKEDKYFQPYSFDWIEENIILMKENKSNYEEKRGPGYPLLYAYFVKDNKIKNIDLNWDWGLGGFYSKSVYFRNGKIFTMLAKGVWNYPIILKVDKNFNVKKRIIIKDGIYKNIDYFTISPDGKKLLFIASRMDKPKKIYLAEILKNGKFKNPKEIYFINSWLKNVKLGKREILHWKSENNRNVEGILIYPADYEESKKYPLVITFHGGPYAYTKDSFNNSWAYYPQALAGDGFFTLFVNYWGGSNYGLEFAESIVGKYYELEVPDIMSGLDFVLKNYNIDKKNIGVMGWSNGAILTIASILERDFKFAIQGAGDVNWISDWGNCKFGVQFDNLYLGKPYYEDLELYIKKSPLFKLKKVNTPVLIFFGDKDTNVPTEQGWEFYRTMEQLGKEVKFVLMPGEPHSFRKLSHQKRKVMEEIEWIHSHIEGKNKESFELLKKDSKIAQLEKYLKLKKDKTGEIGEKVKGILLPEFVKIGNVKVAKTELTNAQFNEFLKEKYPERIIKGNPNKPVYNIPQSLINEYLKFVFEKTGLKVKLITKKLFEEISTKEISKTENTIDYWIGYSPTPEERIEWIKYLKKKKLVSNLIMPVASFQPTASGIYDLNGNLPELTEEGEIVGNWFLSTKNGKKIKCRKNWAGIRLIVTEEKK